MIDKALDEDGMIKDPFKDLPDEPEFEGLPENLAELDEFGESSIDDDDFIPAVPVPVQEEEPEEESGVENQEAAEGEEKEEKKIEIRLDTIDMARYGYTPKLTTDTISDAALARTTSLGRAALERYLTDEFQMPARVIMHPFSLKMTHPSDIKPGRLRETIHQALAEPLSLSGLVAIYCAPVPEQEGPNADFIDLLEIDMEEGEKARPIDRLSRWLIARARTTRYPEGSYFLATPTEAFLLELWSKKQQFDIVTPKGAETEQTNSGNVTVGPASLEWGRPAYALLLEEAPAPIWHLAVQRVAEHDIELVLEVLQGARWPQGYTPNPRHFVSLLTHPNLEVRSRATSALQSAARSTPRR